VVATADADVVAAAIIAEAVVAARTLRLVPLLRRPRALTASPPLSRPLVRVRVRAAEEVDTAVATEAPRVATMVEPRAKVTNSLAALAVVVAAVVVAVIVALIVEVPMLAVIAAVPMLAVTASESVLKQRVSWNERHESAAGKSSITSLATMVSQQNRTFLCHAN